MYQVKVMEDNKEVGIAQIFFAVTPSISHASKGTKGWFANITLDSGESTMYFQIDLTPGESVDYLKKEAMKYVPAWHKAGV